MSTANQPSLVHITTVPLTLRFFRGQVDWVRQQGFALSFVSSPGELLDRFGKEYGVPVFGVPMARRITPLRDLAALAALWRLLRRLRPDIVHAHTPKGGLLGMVAAWLAGVPVRIYHMRGLPFMTATGTRRHLLRATERVSCALAHQVYCVSRSLESVAIEEKLSVPQKITVAASGSSNGVDARGRYNPERLGERGRETSRASLDIPAGALVVGFVGRLVRDKGVVELTEAWRRLRDDHPAARLLIVGPAESRDALPEAVMGALHGDERVHLVGFVEDTATCYAAMDVVALPTYREGFPNVPLEAAAMGLPVVATRIPGCVDAIEDGVTGTLVPTADSEALRVALDAYLSDERLRQRHGAAGRRRALVDFDPQRIWEALVAGYRRLLDERVTPPGRARSAGASSPRAGLGATLKRVIDLMGASAMLIATAPLQLGVAASAARYLGRPVLFRQQRPGLDGKPFTLLKFRTMTEAREPDGRLKPDADRLTPFGQFLRRTSLDELPTLWNVLRGDMSLVGPRPLLMQYLPRYSPEQARRHQVRPGVTGWAQINGRNSVSWDEKFAFDVWYVDNQSLALDLRVLLKTVTAVLKREGISHDGAATMPEFMGNEVE